MRERLYRAPYYRLVFGESDGLPGLVLDRYGDVVVGQIATAGMEALRETVAEAARALLSPAVLYWKNDSAVRLLEQLPQITTTAFGEAPAEITAIEADLRFAAPLTQGQKTGWFYDQTHNRTRLVRYLGRRHGSWTYAATWAPGASPH